MNKRGYSILLGFISVFVLLSCSKKIDFTQMQSREGKLFEVNNSEPFSGVVEGYLHAENAKKMKSLESFADDIYYYDQSINYKINVKNGLLDGEVIATDSKGHEVVKDNYHNGEKEGTSQRFFKNGQLRYSVNYKNGKIDGDVKYYDENGSLAKEEKYEHGNPIVETLYSSDGNKEKEFDYTQKEATFIICGEQYTIQWHDVKRNGEILEICDYKTFRHYNKTSNGYDDYSSKLLRGIDPSDALNTFFFEREQFHKTIKIVICEGKSI